MILMPSSIFGAAARPGPCSPMHHPLRTLLLAIIRRTAQQSAVVLCVIAALLSRPAEAADHLTVLLDWFVNPDHAPILVAQQIGAFARAGLDVELIAPADANMPPRLVAAGHGDIALTAQPQLYEQVAGGLSLVRIGALIDRPLSTLVSLRQTGITSAAGLKGKRIGYGSGDMERAMVGAILASAGLSLHDVTMVQVGEQLSVSLLTHQVDAVTVYRNFESIELRENGAKIESLDYETHGVPWFDELIFVVRRDAANDARFPRFLQAVAEGAAYLRAHPQDCWNRFAAAHPDLNNSLNHDAWFATVPYFAADPFALDAARYDAFAAFLVRAGVLTGAPRLGDYTRVLRAR
jgi:putative hydroxymethylpyrimidine transport system substrate-binding protein